MTRPSTGAPVSAPLLELSHVGVAYGPRTVLEDITVTVPPGQFVGVIGPNGAGKTTLLRVILGLVTPTTGTVRLAGAIVRRGSRHVGYVPQSFAADADLPLRARDLVGLGLDGERWGLPLPGADRRRRVDAILERVGATHYAGARIGELSGGERQRLLVAQALVADPDVVLLDEPLSNLDIGSAHEIVRLVRDLVSERQLAALLVAHDMNPLLGAMDQVLYLARGRAAVGPVDEVVSSEVLSGLYGYPVEVLRVRGRIVVVAGEEGEAGLPAARPHSHPEHAQAGPGRRART
jgi:zinc/manganese transport system ATP-binding protein